ncbi:MAG: segregation/condensation protein A [Geobacter sp.]|nr:segregation/condensation protein A [Geobacter sp.]
MPDTAPSQPLFDSQQFSAYSVKVESFEGPLDLLLHLIKKNELDIYDIPIAIVTRQYLEYLEVMKELNLEIAGEFLVMASTLLQIKSKLLLPLPEEEDSGEDEELDPRAELVRRLLEYQKYKEAAAGLAGRELLGRDVFTRTIPFVDESLLPAGEEPLEIELFELVDAFRRVLARIPVERFHEVVSESISVADRIGRILDLVQSRQSVQFDDLFDDEEITRELAIATFLALLELCKLKTIKVSQLTPFGVIWLVPGALEPEEDSAGVDDDDSEKP